jgi:hypothetical protein
VPLKGSLCYPVTSHCGARIRAPFSLAQSMCYVPFSRYAS